MGYRVTRITTDDGRYKVQAVDGESGIAVK